MKNNKNQNEILENNFENELDFKTNQNVWEEIDSLEKKETIVKREPKVKHKIDKPKKDKNKKMNSLKKLFFGVGKEFERVTWTTKKELASSFLITLVVVCFFAIIFTVISLLITGAKL